jgi:voltage-gated potassium channel
VLAGIALLGVVTATIAGWFIERLRRVQENVTKIEERTEATIEQVLAELRELRARLDEPGGTG